MRGRRAGIGASTPARPSPLAGGDEEEVRGRRGAIDVARVLALALVVAGHLALAVIDKPDGHVRGANLIALHPGLAWLLAVAPMPVFFAAAGWANADATPQSAALRLRMLVGLGTVIVGCWTVAVIVAMAITGAPGVVGKGARIATQPLWFVAAYAPLAAAGRRMATTAARRPAIVVGVCLGGLAVIDLARFGAGWPRWIGWPGFYLAWAVPWFLGGWWRDRFERARLHERRTGIALALVAGAAAVALVEVAGYSPALIDAVPAARSNTTPPTLYTAIVGIAQVGVLITVAHLLDRIARRWRPFWDRAGVAAIGVYLWHLTALALCAAAVAVVVPMPRRLSGSWWATRPAWYSAVLALTAGLVSLTDLVHAGLRRRRGVPGPPTRGRATVGVVVAAIAAGAVGLRGPTSIARALAWTALLALAWVMLRGDATGRTGAPAPRQPLDCVASAATSRPRAHDPVRHRRGLDGTDLGERP